MKVVPQAFYQNPAIQKVLVDGLSAVIYKSVEKAGLNNERFVAAPALTFVLQGALQISTDSGIREVVETEHLVLIPKGIYMISDLIPEEGGFEAMVFFFDPNLIQDFLQDFSEIKIEHREASLQIFEQSSSTQLFIENLNRLYQEQALPRKLTGIKLQELLHLLVAGKEGKHVLAGLQALNRKPRKNVKHFMETNFYKPLNVEDYAFLTGRSISTFTRDFKRQFGISPKKWLIEKRLNKASEILRNENKSVTETAFDVGYENISHFIKAFQKKYGISPKQFVLQHRQSLIV